MVLKHSCLSLFNSTNPLVSGFNAPEELAGLADTLNNTFDHLHESIETQKRFSADASHELRTPIAIVIAQAEAALKRERTSDEYQSVLKACLHAGQRMKNMANSLLELTRLDGAGVALVKTRCILNEVISDAVESASALSEKHPVSFHCLEKHLVAEIDPPRIHQVMMNLLSNAIQHNPDGCEIQVVLETTDREAVIKIIDEGVGISKESLPHIFDRFYRVDKSRSHEHGGVGLGLSIVKSLVEAHGGNIAVSSIFNQSTTFTIRLPLS